MRKYEPLWNHLAKLDARTQKMTFAEIGQICGFELDHSFLNCKRELLAYGWKVGKISLKEKSVRFERQDGASE